MAKCITVMFPGRRLYGCRPGVFYEDEDEIFLTSAVNEINFGDISTQEKEENFCQSYQRCLM